MDESIEGPVYYRHHSDEARRVLQKASLSMNSELTAEGCDRLQHAVEWLAADPEVSGWQLRNLIMPQSNQPADVELADNEGESKMAATKAKQRRGRPARPELSKAQVTKLAKLRREGATWFDINDAAGQRHSSTDWAKLFKKHGFDKLGRQGGKGESKARAWGSATAKANGKPAAKPAKKRVRKTKATAKK